MSTAHKQSITVIIPVLSDSTQTVSEMTDECMRSIAKAWLQVKSRVSLRMVLFMNGIDRFDGKIPTLSGITVSVVCSLQNKGFTGAVNRSIHFSLASFKQEWFLVINNDATVDELFFTQLMPRLKSTAAVVSCGVRTRDGVLESNGLTYGQTGLAFPQQSLRLNKHLFCGTCFFISSEATTSLLEKDGYVFNPLFFAYAEDVELSIRLKLLGKKVLTVPKILVTHLGSATAGRASRSQLYFSYRNVLFTMVLTWDLGYLLIHTPAIIVGQLYVLLVLLSKGYLEIYPKIIWYLCKFWRELLFIRKNYGSSTTLFTGF